MTSVEQLYRQHLAAVTLPDEDRIREIWEPDGVVEFPYAPAAGVSRLDGITAIVDYFTALPLFGAFTFPALELHPVGVDPSATGYLVEMHGSSTLRANGAPYEQDYVVRFRLSPRGRLAWLREYWDPTQI